jgi:hypothetical protein
MFAHKVLEKKDICVAYVIKTKKSPMKSYFGAPKIIFFTQAKKYLFFMKYECTSRYCFSEFSDILKYNF